MVNFLPVKKVLKILSKKCGLKKRTRISKTLTDSIKDVQETKSHAGIKWVIALLLFLICIRLLTVSNSNIKEYNTKKFMSTEEKNPTVINLYTNVSIAKSQDNNLPICYVNTTGFGEISINKTITKHQSRKEYLKVCVGGYYRPEDCKSRHKVAILIPYRDREKNLFIFLYNIHSFLIRQKLEYRIFVIEQKGADYFNRGKLFNAGFLEMKKFGEWHCVIFHDVDLLPLDNRILYSCPTWPLHMCATVVEVKDPKFRSLFGGVSAMDVQHFYTVNGYSNLYWGWGGEDNDLFCRIRAAGLPVVRNSKTIGRYTSLQHPEQSPNPLRFSLLAAATKRFKKEGISTLKYKLDSVTMHHLFTHIIVDISHDRENTTKTLSQWTKIIT